MRAFITRVLLVAGIFVGTGTVMHTEAMTFTKQVTDSDGVVWALAKDLSIWRNGVPANTGIAKDIFLVDGKVQVTGVDGNRWAWTGHNWARVPEAPAYIKQLTDSAGIVWSLAGTQILRNGVPAGGGLGTALFIVNGEIQVEGVDGRPLRWNGAGWELVFVDTGTVTQTEAMPFFKQVTDSDGVVWALADDLSIWRNGVPANTGTAKDMFLVNGKVQVTGWDGNRWAWTGHNWARVP